MPLVVFLLSAQTHSSKMALHKGIESKASHVIRAFNTAPVMTGMMWTERPWACSGCFNTTNKFQCLCGLLFICGNTHEGYFQKSNCSQVCERSIYIYDIYSFDRSLSQKDMRKHLGFSLTAVCIVKDLDLQS